MTRKTSLNEAKHHYTERTPPTQL